MTDIARLPKPTLDVWEWQFDGHCRQVSPEVFFHPEGERGPARRRRQERAVAICRECPVLEECREHALRVNEPYGIWGGMTEDERHAILAEGDTLR